MVSKTIPNVNPLIWSGIGESVINNEQITDDLNWIPIMKMTSF